VFRNYTGFAPIWCRHILWCRAPFYWYDSEATECVTGLTYSTNGI